MTPSADTWSRCSAGCPDRATSWNSAATGSQWPRSPGGASSSCASGGPWCPGRRVMVMAKTKRWRCADGPVGCRCDRGSARAVADRPGLFSPNRRGAGAAAGRLGHGPVAAAGCLSVDPATRPLGLHRAGDQGVRCGGRGAPGRVHHHLLAGVADLLRRHRTGPRSGGGLRGPEPAGPLPAQRPVGGGGGDRRRGARQPGPARRQQRGPRRARGPRPLPG